MCTLISPPYTNNVYSDWSSTRTNQILPLESISSQPQANNTPLTKSFSPDVTDRGFRFQRATKTWIRKRQPFKMSNEKWSSLGTKWHKKLPSQFHQWGQLYKKIIPEKKLSSWNRHWQRVHILALPARESQGLVALWRKADGLMVAFWRNGVNWL